MYIYPVAHIFHIGIYAPAFLAELHYRTYKFARTVNMHIGYRLKRLGNQCGVGIVGRVVHRYRLAVCKHKFVLDARSGGNKVKIIFPFQSLLDYFHM